MTRGDAREAFARSKLSFETMTIEMLRDLRGKLDAHLKAANLIDGTFRMRKICSFRGQGANKSASLRCKSRYFEDREAITFNPDGFVGIAGWADDENVAPIIRGFMEWIASASSMIERTSAYSADERRVSDYIQGITEGLIGSGDDPIGFLIASHASLAHGRCEAIDAAKAAERLQCIRTLLALATEQDVAPDSSLGQLLQQSANAIISGKDPQSPDTPLTIGYTNYRGETAERTIVPRSIRFASTEWHPEPQWLLLAFDLDRNADRDFALRDFI